MALNEAVRQALSKGGTIDITTTGRTSGQPRRIEIVFHNQDGTVYITGVPAGPRSWYANLRAQPAFIFHLKQGVSADLPARATPITDAEERRSILAPVARGVTGEWAGRYTLDDWVQRSPLVSVAFDDS